MTNGGKDRDHWFNNRVYRKVGVFCSCWRRQKGSHITALVHLSGCEQQHRPSLTVLKSNSNGSRNVLLVSTLTLPDRLSATPLFPHTGENIKLQSGAGRSSGLEEMHSNPSTLEILHAPFLKDAV